MSKKQKKDLMLEAELEDEILDIPEDEIWTYRIEGLHAPRIVDKSVKPGLKAGIVIGLIIAISLSIFFSVRALMNEEYDYEKTAAGYELVKYSNPGKVTEVNVDYVDGDTNCPVTEIRAYAFNGDEKLVTVTIGKDVEKIDGKSFFSCWNLESVFVNDDNPYYCDIDGVLYTKDLTRIIYYPSAHNVYLMRQAGYKIDFPEDGSITGDDFTSAVLLLQKCRDKGDDPASLTGDDAKLLKKFNTLTGVTSDYDTFLTDYEEKAGAYVLPSAVTVIGELAFAYSDITRVYIPEGVKRIETLGFFKAEKLKEMYSYTVSEEITSTVFADSADKLTVYPSLPDGLEFIGSDAFTYDRGITYMYIPASVKESGHHAFFNMAFKAGDNIEGLAVMNVQADESGFKAGTKIGESWLPKIDSGLFEKNIPTEYSSAREK